MNRHDSILLQSCVPRLPQVSDDGVSVQLATLGARQLGTRRQRAVHRALHGAVVAVATLAAQIDARSRVFRVVIRENRGQFLGAGFSLWRHIRTLGHFS